MKVQTRVLTVQLSIADKIGDNGVVTPLKKSIYQPILKELKKLGIASKTKITTTQ